MGRGWRIARIFGIDVFVHWSFLLLPALIVLGNFSAGAGAIASGITWIAAVFGCVLLHEFGHALMARQFGVGTRDIVLLPIGGVARLDRMPEKPVQELAIAVAGPAVNVVIAAVLVAMLLITGGISQIAQVPIVSQSFLMNLFFVNIGLVLFNMLPAFPMDGGRVLRAVLAMLMPYGKATRVAASVGRIMAIILGLVGLFTPAKMLIFVGLFIYFVGSAEAAAVAARERWKEQQLQPDEPLPPGSIVFYPPDSWPGRDNPYRPPRYPSPPFPR